MKFGQLIEYDTKNIFLEISCTKCYGKTIPRHFSKLTSTYQNFYDNCYKLKFSMPLDQ